MATQSYITDDHGWDDFIDTLGELSKNSVSAGWFEDTPEYEKLTPDGSREGIGISVTEAAIMNEYGNEGEKIPARHFMENSSEHLLDLWADRMDELIFEKSDHVKSKLKEFGEEMEWALKEALKSGDYVAPISSATQALRQEKGIYSTTPLYETGDNLYEHLTYRING